MSYRNAFKRWNFIRTNLIEFSNLTTETILNHKIGALLFKQYVREEKTNSYSKIMNNWRGYIFCNELIKNLHLLENEKIKEEIYLWRPTYLMRNEIVQIIEEFETDKNEEKIKESLKSLSKQYLKEAEVAQFYDDLMFDIVFDRETVERKLGKVYEEIIERNILINSMNDFIKITPNN